MEGDQHVEEPSIGGTITWNPYTQYTSISSSLMKEFNNSGKTDLTLSKTDTGMYKFSSVMGYFEITGMSYNMKQALGFYYVGDNETIKAEKDSTSESGNTSSYKIEAKAIGNDNFTPVWFLISNLSQPNQITAHNDKWKPLFPAIVMNIQNTFSSQTALTWSNSDYVSDSPTSALNNLKIKVVDGNLEPIHFLNPVYVTVIIQEIPDDEKMEKNEAFEKAEEAKEVKQMIVQTMTKYYNNKEINQQKVEVGVPVEPDSYIFPEKQETKPEEIKLAQAMVKEQAQD